MSDLTHVEQTVDISFGLFFYGSYCPILNTASLKFLARYIVERQMRNKSRPKSGIVCFFPPAAAVVTDSDGGRGCLT